MDARLIERLRDRLIASGTVWWAGVLLAVGLLAAYGLETWHERRALFAQQQARHTLLARVLEDHATRSMGSAWLALGSVADLLARGTAAETIETLLVQTQASLPYLRGTALLDSTGQVLLSSQPAERGRRVDPALLGPWPEPGREAIGRFVPARSLADAGGAPPGVGFVPLLRGVRLPSGQKLLLVALLNPDALANFQEVTLNDARSAAALLALDGQVLAATRSAGVRAGQHRESLLPLQRVRAGDEHGLWEGPGLRDADQLAAFRALRGQPLVLVLETERAGVQGQWLQDTLPLLLMALAAAAALLALARTAAAGLRSRERSRAKLLQAQQALLASEQGLRAQLGLARSLLANSPLPMSVLDRQGRYLDVNRAWEQFTGQRREAVLGRPAAGMQSPQQAAQHDARDRELLSQPPGTELRYESVWTDAQGEPRELFVSKCSFPGPDGQVAGIVVSFWDISVFRAAARATRAARDAALRISEAKSEFIANVSHELRTPLQSILGFSELGRLRARNDARVASMFDDVHRAGQRMLALVNELLDLAKIENAASDAIDPARADVRPLVGEVVAEVQLLAAARSITLQLQQADEELVGLVDGPRLQQVVRNLLANAIKFAPEGSTVEIETAADDEAVRIVVADRGPGIPPAEIDSIFEAFVQSSATKSGAGGTGLGLAICRRLVQAHGGRIHAENRAGGGCAFVVSLPATSFGDTRPAAL